MLVLLGVIARAHTPDSVAVVLSGRGLLTAAAVLHVPMDVLAATGWMSYASPLDTW